MLVPFCLLLLCVCVNKLWVHGVGVEWIIHDHGGLTYQDEVPLWSLCVCCCCLCVWGVGRLRWVDVWRYTMVVYIQYHRLTFSKFNNSKFMCRGGVVAYSRGTGKRQLPGRVRNRLRKCPTRIFLFKYLKMRFMSCRLGTLSYTIQDLKLFLSARAHHKL